LPALAALRRRFPQAEISVLGRPWVTGLFADQPVANRVIAYQSDGAHWGLLGRWALAQEVRRKRFDLAVLFPNSVDAAVVPWLAGIPRRVGTPTEGRRLLLTHPARETLGPTERHQVFRYLAVVRSRARMASTRLRWDPRPQAADRLLAEAASIPGALSGGESGFDVAAPSAGQGRSRQRRMLL
jgi:heptosyltransferase-2